MSKTIWNLFKGTKALEKRYISEALRLCKGNKKKAAKILGIGLSSLYRKIKELKIEKD